MSICKLKTFIPKKLQIVIFLGIGLQACNKIDDYMLGKDNTPKPTNLDAIEPRMDLVKNWSVPVGSAQKSSAYLKMMPNIKGNIIYAASQNGEVKAIEKDSGKTIWTRQLSMPLISGPVVSNGYIALTTDTSDIVLLKQIDGELVWKNRVANDVLAAPLISNNTIIAKTIDGNLYAFNLTSGKKLWVSHHGAPNLILKAGSAPTLYRNNILLTGYADGKLDAIEMATGRVLWQRSIAFASGASDVERLVDIDADPIVRGDTLYLASYQGYIGGLGLNNGQFKWRKPASVFKNITIAGNNIYYTDSDDIVWSLNSGSGHVNWKQDKLKARGLTEPVYSAGKLYLADKAGILHVLSADDGKMIARKSVGASVNLAPVVNDNNVFVQASNGTLSKYKVS